MRLQIQINIKINIISPLTVEVKLRLQKNALKIKNFRPRILF